MHDDSTAPSPSVSFQVGRRTVLGGLGAMAFAPAAAASPVRTRFGVNCYDLFLDGFKPGGRFGTAKLEALGRLGVSFVRFPASAQWAGDWKNNSRDPVRYWAAMDSLFAAAEHAGVGLVPSVIWHPSALAFVMGEWMQAWADPASRTRTFAASYTGEMVRRYDRSPALLSWEFGNELNDWVDLPNVLQFWPKLDPTMPLRGRSELDRLTTANVTAAVAGFAAVVRRHGQKPVGMGSNFPRQNAWHLARGSWSLDTREQFIAQFRTLTPPGCGVMSVHVYPDRCGRAGTIFATLPELLAAVVAAAGDDRTAFVGEFGVPRLLDRAAERRSFDEMLLTLAQSGVPYAALWDYDRRIPDQWTVTATNDRAYQLEALVAANVR